MSLADDVPLALFTMIVGAILGAVLTPVGDAVTNSFFERRKKQRDLYSGFLLFFAANGIWIIGEIFVELFVRSSGNVGWSTASVIASIFGFAAFTFAVGYKHLPNEKSHPSTDRSLARALSFLISGNMLWISGEIFETIAWELWPDQPYFIGYPATWLRILFLLAALGTFARGMVIAWRLTPTTSTIVDANNQREEPRYSRVGIKDTLNRPIRSNNKHGKRRRD